MSKNNLIKRTLAIALAVVLTIGSAPLTGFIGMELPPIGSLFASAADEEIVWTVATADMLKIEANTITGYTDKLSGNIEIPSSIDGVAITKIASSAFNGCSGLTAVKIPGSITEIGWYAFQNCANLKTVYFNANNCSVSSNDYAPFNGNINFTEIVFGENV
ncbi:MAG: leucine-rich repeat protein, partial [Clostridia bacterium]|nr:leucine-rich repeat protein [Clostridia bacterium]MBQ4338203.1 leucine-rich repeat protein [Clostridia bacterium]